MKMSHLVSGLKIDLGLNIIDNPASIFSGEVEQLLGISELTESTVASHLHFDCANPTNVRDTYPLSRLPLLHEGFTLARAKRALR